MKVGATPPPRGHPSAGQVEDDGRAVHGDVARAAAMERVHTPSSPTTTSPSPARVSWGPVKEKWSDAIRLAIADWAHAFDVSAAATDRQEVAGPVAAAHPCRSPLQDRQPVRPRQT